MSGGRLQPFGSTSPEHRPRWVLHCLDFSLVMCALTVGFHEPDHFVVLSAENVDQLWIPSC